MVRVRRTLPKKEKKPRLTSSPTLKARCSNRLRGRSGWPSRWPRRFSHHRKDADQGRSGHERSPGPQGPVLGLAEHEGRGDGADAGGEQHHAERVEPVGHIGSRLGEEPAGQDDGHDADGHVDQEDRAPAPAEEVEVEQHAAEDLPGHRAQADGHAEEREHPGSLVGAEVGGQEGQHLRDHGGRPEPLGQAAHDQDGAGRSDPREQRGGGEDGQADHEHAPPADQIAQPGPGDQAGRVAEGVAGHHQLQGGRRGVQVPLDAGGGHVDHEDVEERHERGRQHHRQRPPATGVVGWGGVGRSRSQAPAGSGPRTGSMSRLGECHGGRSVSSGESVAIVRCL